MKQALRLAKDGGLVPDIPTTCLGIRQTCIDQQRPDMDTVESFPPFRGLFFFFSPMLL